MIKFFDLLSQLFIGIVVFLIGFSFAYNPNGTNDNLELRKLRFENKELVQTLNTVRGACGLSSEDK